MGGQKSRQETLLEERRWRFIATALLKLKVTAASGSHHITTQWQTMNIIIFPKYQQQWHLSYVGRIWRTKLAIPKSFYCNAFWISMTMPGHLNSRFRESCPCDSPNYGPTSVPITISISFVLESCIDPTFTKMAVTREHAWMHDAFNGSLRVWNYTGTILES